MSRVTFQPQTPIQANIKVVKRWVPSMALWGAGAGAAALLVLSVTPLVKREVLVKVPVLKTFYEDKTPASDKPF